MNMHCTYVYPSAGYIIHYSEPEVYESTVFWFPATAIFADIADKNSLSKKTGYEIPVAKS